MINSGNTNHFALYNPHPAECIQVKLDPRLGLQIISAFTRCDIQCDSMGMRKTKTAQNSQGKSGAWATCTIWRTYSVWGSYLCDYLIPACNRPIQPPKTGWILQFQFRHLYTRNFVWYWDLSLMNTAPCYPNDRERRKQSLICKIFTTPTERLQLASRNQRTWCV